jgi:catechol 2,3-dioxygenase-like lactoylglutathione lyase family enzyme
MLSHLTFMVHDLKKATLFFETVFDAKEVYSSDKEQFSIAAEKFFLIDDLWIAVMQGEALPTKTYNHVAFKIQESEYDLYLSKIAQLGLEVKAGRERVIGEGNSIYFYDFDNHLFELHTGTLSERLKRYNHS